MRRIYYLCLLSVCLLLHIPSGHAGYYNWAKTFGDVAANVDVGKAIVSDNAGNVYLTGLFHGTVDFDPSANTFNLTAGGGSENIFFAKFNANGNFIWARQLGDANLSKGIDIQVDNSGNVYLLAHFEQSTVLDLDPGIGVSNVVAQGNKSIAFAKYNSNGNFVWGNSISGSGDCVGASIALGLNGSVYVAGSFKLTADFDPSIATQNLTAVGSNNGFVAMYDNAGNYAWAKQLTAAGGASQIKDLTTDNNGALYITGSYNTNCDFNMDAGSFPRSNDGNSDFFVGKYTEQGAFTWALALDGTGEDFGNAIAVDAYHHVYVAGTFTDSLETDPSPVDNYIESTSPGFNDNFVVKYDDLGQAIWAFGFGNAQVDYCNAMSITSEGNFYLCGAYSGTLDFDPTTGTTSISSSSYNTYLASYASDGSLLWVNDLGGTAYDEATALFVKDADLIYMTGYFGDEVDFNAGQFDTALFNGGVADIFMVKHSTEIPISIQLPIENATWLVDGNYPIRWQCNGIDSIHIERQEIGQTTWETLAKVEDFPLTYFYHLPVNNPLVDYTIRVSDWLNPSVYYTTTVHVKFAPQLNYPSGGEVLSGDSLVTVNWFATGNNANFSDLKFSVNGGANWIVMRDSVQTFFETDSGFFIGNYNWKVPKNINSSNCKVALFDVNQTVPVFISNAFTIQPSAPTSFQLISPNGAEVLERKRHFYITWTGVSMPPFVLLEYSLNGINYFPIDTVANSGYYNWRVKDAVSANCFIRVGTINGSSSDTNDAPFEITDPNSDVAELTSPVFGDNWCEGTQQYIRWTSNIAGKVTLWYKPNSGSDILIDTVNAADGMYYWTVPNNPSFGNRIRIEPADGSGTNLSTSPNFVICPNTPSLHVLSPNGGNAFYPGCYVALSWEANRISLVDLYYSIDNGTNWYLIDSNINQSPYYWIVPDSTSTACLFRVNQSQGTITDQSDLTFSMLAPFSGNLPNLIINNVAVTPCKLDTFSVSFTVSGLNFDTANTFMIQLSDSSGNFSTGITTIGVRKDSVSGSINCSIPAFVPNSLVYQIRVVADNPPFISVPTSLPGIESPEFTFRDSTLYSFLPNSQINFPSIGSLPPGSAVHWTFGDGNSSSLVQPVHLYGNAGIFDVGVEVTNANGCKLRKVNKGYVRVDKRFPNSVLNANKIQTVSGISFKNDSTGTISYSDGTVKFTNDNGLNWYAVQSTGLSDVSAIKMRNADLWIVVGSNGGVRKTLNRGLSWDTVSFNNNTNPTVKLNAVDFSTPLSGYIAGDSGKVYRYTGTKFIPAPQFTTVNLYTVFDDGTNAFVAGDSGKIVKRSAGIWTHKNSGINTAIRSIVFSPNNPAKGYAVGDKGKIIQSNDAGETWDLSLAGVDINFSSIACSENGDSAWAVGEAGIIYQTTDFGQSWERFSKGATTANTRVTFKKPRGYIAGSSGSLRTFYPVNNQSTLGIRNLLRTPEAPLYLFPNPAKSSLNLKLELDYYGQVMILIKDVNGKLVSEPMSQVIDNSISKQISVSNLKDGIYFLHVQLEDAYVIKKFVVIH